MSEHISLPPSAPLAESESTSPTISQRVHRKLTQETTEVVGGVAAGSLAFITTFEWLVVAGISNPAALITAAFSAAGVAVLGDTAVHAMRQERDRRQ